MTEFVYLVKLLSQSLGFLLLGPLGAAIAVPVASLAKYLLEQRALKARKID